MLPIDTHQAALKRHGRTSKPMTQRGLGSIQEKRETAGDGEKGPQRFLIWPPVGA